MSGVRPRKVLLVGATGTLGAEILRIFAETGTSCRVAARNVLRLHRHPGAHLERVQCDLRLRDDVARAVAGVEVVLSCVGASLDLRAFRSRASYASVDYELNLKLLEAAVAAGVERFVYVSVYSTPELSRTAYVRAHERFANALRQSDLRSVVVQPTGFFRSFLEMLRMAKRARAVVIGSGEARTNPIHEADVALQCVDAISTDASCIEAGGPEVLTRRDIQALAFRAIGRTPRISKAPAALFLTAAAALRPFHPRLGELLEFGTVASTVDVVAPARGERGLEQYFREAGRLPLSAESAS